MNNTCGTCETTRKWSSGAIWCTSKKSIYSDCPKYVDDTCDHHTPKENDIDARIEYSEQLSDGIPQPTAGHEPGYTPGPWTWHINVKTKSWHLCTVHGGRIFVLGAERWGLQMTKPMFQSLKPGRIEPVTEFITPNHNGEAFEINHPDARLIAKAPTLVRENERLRTAIQAELDRIEESASQGCMNSVLSVICDNLTTALTAGGDDVKR